MKENEFKIVISDETLIRAQVRFFDTFMTENGDDARSAICSGFTKVMKEMGVYEQFVEYINYLASDGISSNPAYRR